MYEIEIINTITKEETILFGTSCKKAFEKAGLNPEEWKVLRMEYVD